MTVEAVDRSARTADVIGDREGILRFDLRAWIALPAVFCALALPQILHGVVGLGAGVAAGVVACVALWPLRGTLLRRPSRAFFYAGLLFVGAPALRPIAGETTADWLFAASVLSLFVELVLRPGVRIRLPSVWLLAGGTLVAVGSLLSALASDTPSSALGAGIRFMLVTVAWIWLGVLVLDRLNHLCVAVLAWAISAAASSVAGFAQLAFGDVIPGTTPDWNRMTGLGQQVNEFGAVTATAMIPTAALVLLTRGRDRRLTALLVLAMIGGLLLSGSISSMAGVAVGSIVAVVLDRRRFTKVVARPRILVAGGAALVAVVAAVWVAAAAGWVVSPWARLTTTTSVAGGTGLAQQQATLWRRIDTLRIGWTTIKEHPIFGAGKNPDGVALAHGTYVHNTLLGAWAGLGLLATVGLILCLAAPFVATHQLLRLRPNIRTLVIGLTGGAVAFTVYALANPSLYRRYGWVPALFLVALSPQALPRRAVEPRRRENGRAAAETRRWMPAGLSFAPTMRRAVIFVTATAVVAIGVVAAYALASRDDGGAKTAVTAPTNTVTPTTTATVPAARPHLLSQHDIDRYAATSPQHALLTWWRAAQFVDYPGFLEGFDRRVQRQLAADAETKRFLPAFGAFANTATVTFVDVRKTPARATVYTEVHSDATSPDGERVTNTYPRVFRLVRQGGAWRLQNSDFFREVVPSSLQGG
jgi:O-antigen ligase